MGAAFQGRAAFRYTGIPEYRPGIPECRHTVIPGKWDNWA